MEEAGFTDEYIKKCNNWLDINEYGITCLSARKISYLPMWAYYTNNYNGFCVEYELRSKACIHEVMYEPKRIQIASLILRLQRALKEEFIRGTSRSIESRTIARMLFQILFIKSKSWEHEEEYRIVQPISNVIGENIKIADLGMKTCKIVAGINCSPTNLKRLNIISNQIGCGNAYTTRLSGVEYTLVEERM